MSTKKVWDVAKLRENALKTALRGECRIDLELLVGVIDQLEAERDEAAARVLALFDRIEQLEDFVRRTDGSIPECVCTDPACNEPWHALVALGWPR